MAGPAVRVRMYRQGLGDCFLITFDVGGDEAHVLLDCGSLGATTTGVRLRDVITNVRQATGDRLHALIATHEHRDHVSGFGSEQAAFEAMQVDRVWLAWTENPNDAQAKKLAKYKKDLAAALVQASRALTGAGRSAESKATGLAVGDVLGFAGDPDALGAFAETVDRAMDFVRRGLVDRARYFKPGDGPLAPDWLPGFRVYVLGPPRSEEALNRLGGHGSSELYGLAGAVGAAAAFRASGQSISAYLAAAESGDREAFDASQPFDPRFRVERESARARELYPHYVDADAWRQVDEDWMYVAADLALQLDSATNNTSLALAFERIADGKVLIFPADAQEGNWLSWHGEGMAWTVTGDGPPRTVTAGDLLSRAVFYKVGHHGSHNGTAKGRGLELMEQEQELTAFIPVDRAVALNRHPKGTWRMPALELYRALLEKCQGRVVRSDLGWAADAATAANAEVEAELRELAPPARWAQWKASQEAATHVTITELFVDYLLE